MRNFKLTFFLLVLLVSGVVPARAGVQAAPGSALATCENLSAVEWRESRTRSFAILYPVEQEAFGRVIADQFGEQLDAEYARFAALFETSLSLPVSVRIYPTENHYYCLNAQAPGLLPGATHSHIGTREIALISENIATDFTAWATTYQNDFRFEQAALFTEHVTGSKAPPGLLTAVSHWAQDPSETLGKLTFPRVNWSTPTYTWRQLWEDTASQSDFGARLQATSTVAFLIDAHGWAPFLELLKGLSSTESYRQEMEEAFGTDFSALEEQWQSYYPAYFRGRYRTHLIYNYDLSPYQEMLEGGEYFQVDQELQTTVKFLEKINQPDKLDRARTLLEWARTGQEAEKLVAQSRQVLDQGDYVQVIVLVEQARQKYLQIENYRRLDELDAYSDQVRQILALHIEMENLQAQVNAGQVGYGMVRQLINLDRRMGALGDHPGQQQVRQLAAQVEARLQSWQYLLVLGVAWIILGLLVIRIWLAWRRPAPEAQL